MALRVNFFSVANWNHVALWEDVFSKVESILGSRLTYLDRNDPLRRKVVPDSLKQQAEYACGFTPDDGTVHLFGKFERAGIRLALVHHNVPCMFIQSLSFVLPDEYAEADLQSTVRLFQLGTRLLAPFYAYADYDYWVASRYPGSGRVNYETELRGIAWLTYLSRAYVQFFGEDVIKATRGVKRDRRRGATIKLADSPSELDLKDKLAVQEALGRDSFFNPRAKKPKAPGIHALSFDTLRQECPETLSW